MSNMAEGRAFLDALIRSREDAECSECGHLISKHGRDGCESMVANLDGDESTDVLEQCLCQAWTTEPDTESTEYRHGN